MKKFEESVKWYAKGVDFNPKDSISVKEEGNAIKDSEKLKKQWNAASNQLKIIQKTIYHTF